MSFRIGIGYDVHRLEEGREFILGGIKVPFEKGPVGHSDGDVLIHAICDALLGALALGDIGKQFPDTDEEFRDIDSKILLEKTINMIRFYGYEISNIDSTVCLQKPKISKYIPDMVKALSDVLKIDTHLVSVKATTTEKLGFVGEEQGVSAYAVALLVLS
ncbi:MAG TPA: 2-C-methyl-D-erythritol 2,4-cyclodiphosphate synthase [Bacteroides sp.]|nr:2-C-methyl-D-erythritol 2,4-cyclodiphosphate synthase [Bacteroides sp.]